MKNKQLLDLYSDYLLSSFVFTTAVGLSELLDKGYSHDQISRFLAQKKLLSKDLWKLVKPLIRKVEHPMSVLAIDDTIEEKPHTTENDIVCWHWDHSKKRNVKGINILNFLYIAKNEIKEDIKLPVAYEIIEKKEQFYDKKSDKIKRRSAVSKNQLVRERLRILTHINKVKFKYITWDSWFSSKENLELVHYDLKKKFVVALKDNRLVSLSENEKRQGKFTQVSELDFEVNSPKTVWLKGLDFPIKIIKQIFKNQDDSTGEQYLITNDSGLTYDQICTIYQKRWSVEVFHKSLKQNASLAKSPTKNETTQSNHIFASMIAYCKLEILKFKQQMNHFQLKSRLYIHAVKAAFKELQHLKTKNEQLQLYAKINILPETV